MIDNTSSSSSALSRLADIASIIIVLVLGVTAVGELPSWAILLVPFWVAVLCYLNLDRLVHLGIGSVER